MTNVKLIDIYLDGFRAYHYDKKPNSSCPYAEGSSQFKEWKKGYHYALVADKVVTHKIISHLPN